MENLFDRFSLFLSFRYCLFFRLLVFLGDNFVRETFGFPGSLEKILEGFSFDRRDLFFDFGQELKLFRLFICALDIFVYDF